jgi:hypothetical protein
MSEKVTLSTIRVTAVDMDGDEQVWLQSSIAATHKLHKRLKDDFSFSDTDIVMIPNRGETAAVITIEAFRCGEGALYIGSNRRAGTVLKQGESLRLKMRGRETLTVRSVEAREPQTTHSDGSHVKIRPGQSVVIS